MVLPVPEEHLLPEPGRDAENSLTLGGADETLRRSSLLALPPQKGRRSTSAAPGKAAAERAAAIFFPVTLFASFRSISYSPL